MDAIIALLYGIIEGITEWLPVSSTGHLILFENFMPFKTASADFLDMFRVVIQLGAILAVVILYWNKIWPFGFSKKKITVNGDTMSLWYKIIIACVPAAIVGLLFDEALEELFYNPTTVAISLAVFGIIFIVVEAKNKNKQPKIDSLNSLTYKTAIFIGVFQLIAAVFPGTSRSGATIIGALLMGVSRTVAAEFTFFLAIPVMFGASLLKVVKFLADGLSMSGSEWMILVIGFVTAFVVSITAIKFLMGYIKKRDFTAFGIYRIVLAIIVMLYFGLK